MIDIGIHQIHKNYGYNTILDHIDLEIKTKDRVAIVGKNGAGKTTLFKIITKQEYADQGSIYIKKNATIGYLEQIPETLDKDQLVIDVLLDNFKDIIELKHQLTTLENKMTTSTNDLDTILETYSTIQNQFISLGGYQMEEKLNKITQRLKISHLLESTFNLLSGGEKTIVKLASVLLREPNILLLDEPTNHLDISTLDWLETYLKNYSGTIVMISHDRYFLDRIANKTILLEQGNATTFHGNYSFALEQQRLILLQEFDKYKNQQKKIKAMQEAAKRFRDWGNQGDNEKFFKKAKQIEKKLREMEVLDKPILEKKKLPISFKEKYISEIVIKVDHLNFSFEDKHLYQNASFSIYHKEKVALIGDNGTGKTTLIKLLLNQSDENSNTIKLAKNASIGYIPQVIEFNNPNATILDTFIDECPTLRQQARFLLSKFSIYGKQVFKQVQSLSGGEKMLLKLAILLQKDINFLILDEPTNHIDIDIRETLEETLVDYKGTILFISHDRYFISKVANKIIEIKDQTFISYGSLKLHGDSQ